MSRRTPAVSFLACAAIAAVTLASLYEGHVNHDAAVYLHGADVVLDGGTLYRDYIETNPPLITWLSIPASALGRVLGSGAVALWLYVIAVLGAVLAFDHRLLGHVYRGEVGSERWWVLVGLAAGLFWLPAYDFSQREHFFLVLASPWLLTTLATVRGREVPRPERIVAALLAAIGLCLKPHFALFWVVVEVGAAVLRRTPWHLLRLESAIIAGAFLVYAALVAVLYPDYLGFVVPLALETYGAYRSSWWALFDLPTVVTLVLAAGLTAWIVASGRARDIEWSWLVAVLGALLVYLVQRRGWYYHLYPVMALLLVLAVTTTARTLAEYRSTAAPRATPLVGLALSVLLVAQLGSMALASWKDDWGRAARGELPRLIALLRADTAEGSAYPFTTEIGLVHPALVHAGRPWISTWPMIWPIPALYVGADDLGPSLYRSPEEMGPTERMVLDTIYRDLAERDPDLLLFDTVNTRFGDLDFRWYAYLDGQPRFHALLQDYRFLENTGTYDVYIGR